MLKSAQSPPNPLWSLAIGVQKKQHLAAAAVSKATAPALQPALKNVLASISSGLRCVDRLALSDW